MTDDRQVPSESREPASSTGRQQSDAEREASDRAEQAALAAAEDQEPGGTDEQELDDATPAESTIAPPTHRPLTATSPIGLVDSLTLRSEAAAAVGSVLLSTGMASYRVKRAMWTVAEKLGLDSFVAIVTFTDITATATLGGRYRTRVTRPSHVGVDVDRMHRVLRMIDGLPDEVTAAEVHEALARTARPPRYGALGVILAAGLACGAFAFLNGGGPVEMISALVGAAAGQAVRRRLQKRQWNHFLVTVIAAAVAAAAALVVVESIGLMGLSTGHHLGGYLAAVLFLVPGFPMITGILDLVRSDYSAGLARLAYASLMVIGAAATIWMAGMTVGAAGKAIPELALPFGLELGLRAAATFIGVVGFAVLFNSPWRIAVGAGAISIVANSLRYALTEAGLPIQVSTFLATFVVGVTAYGVARLTHWPRTALSVPAVVIMIPGFAMYSSYALLNAGDVTGSLLLVQEAVQVVLAAGFGLAIAHLATSSDWRRISARH